MEAVYIQLNNLGEFPHICSPGRENSWEMPEQTFNAEPLNSKELAVQALCSVSPQHNVGIVKGGVLFSARLEQSLVGNAVPSGVGGGKPWTRGWFHSS